MKNITIEQLHELGDYNYAWFAIKFMGYRSYRNQESMDKQVSKACTSKRLKEFLVKYGVGEVADTDDLSTLWEKVKETVKRLNQ
ncbi:hypothetical protein [Bacillus sp. NPDC094106]|uniref:hypothetical protein n=1 Tax=Bacillus sp. NPDC094106 TaxID=3363949 RepID=UPI0037F977EC